MDRKKYKELEAYMLSCMNDSAHDKNHIYRVLYVALDIAGHETGVDFDILITACLLHDIGREEQFKDPTVCHALAGSEKAYSFLVAKGWDIKKASHVKECITSHRYRAADEPKSIEAKILYDADKVDVVGAIGIARTLFYAGQVSEPLYSLLEDGTVSDGSGDENESFFRVYKFKLEKLHDELYTSRGAEIAKQRQAAAVSFYESMLKEVRSSYKGAELLEIRLG